VRAKAYHRIIGVVLAIVWIVFVSLLAGVGSDVLTNPPAT